MAIFTYTYQDEQFNQPIYRIGNELGANLTFTQDTLLAVIGEAVGTGDGTTVTFPLDFDRVRLGSVHVFKDAVEVFDFSTVLQDGVLIFDTAPANGVIITADYNHMGDLTFQYDATLPMTISGTGMGNFNQIMNDLNIVQSIQTYFNVSATVDEQFDFVITVSAV